MKHLSLIIITLLLILFFGLEKKVYAWGIKNADFDIIGMSCGIPGSDINKCCAGPHVEFDLNLSTGNPIVDAALLPINGVASAFELILNGLTNSLPVKVKQLTDKFIGIKEAACFKSTPSSTDPSDPSCICVPDNQTALPAAVELCETISTVNEKEDCKKCVLGNTLNKKAGIWTAIGCVYADLGTFIQTTLLGWGIGLAGLIAFVCIIYAAIMLQTSSGNPERIKKAQEMLTSCIMGLMLIIFSVFILRLIGVDILRIPGFGK